MSRIPIHPFTAFLTLVVVVLGLGTLSLGPVSREAPLWTLTTTFTLMVLQLLMEAVPPLAARLPSLQRDSLFGASRHLGDWRRAASRSGRPGGTGPRTVRIGLWLTGFVVLVYTVGFGPAIPIFLLPYLRTEARLGWTGSLLVTGAVAGILHLIFGGSLGLTLPDGAIL